ncbi:putative colanic acid biosynthesis acetyltransferase [Croceicoccus sp. YJ47]|uniref:putative colanic acid biosynthesis acetyltransferase n=1 Tax=Croceicoccus sp. YJ47 TaxID=2798724 RepID=UPI001924E7E2|nr:putative colanic acid biosynthesis acetyltransferase [Croceicoccus sp. YJ47]QQN72985.1 putative colanic acid biosynthesis acetyltransferase [Croceicoccus sp. YJ47]
MTPLDAGTAKPMEGGPSFSLGNRIFRVLWGLSWLLLARWTPPPLHKWRRLVLRAFGADISGNARIYGSVSIWHPGNLSIGGHAVIGPGVRLYNQGHIRIGERSIISQRSHICASTHDVRDPEFQLQLRPITIGRECWVAAEAFVGPGVTMGDEAVLGARGVLMRDAEPNMIYRGNPAEPVRTRDLRRA